MLTIREQNLRGVKALTGEWRQGAPSPTSELWPLPGRSALCASRVCGLRKRRAGRGALQTVRGSSFQLSAAELPSEIHTPVALQGEAAAEVLAESPEPLPVG